MLRQLFSAVKSTITSPITAITAITATTTTAAATRTMSTTPPASPLKKPCKLALLQLASGNDKSANLANARKQVAAAAARGANIVVLPECFNSPYGTSYFRQYAEPIPHGDTTYPESLTPSYTALSAAARENNIYLIGGSIPEHDPSTDALYNTSLAFAPTGALLAAHRKIHLFDIDIPGKIRFIESEVLSPGAHPTLIDTPYGRVGVAICYDVRFPELAMLAARQGAFAMLYPGAFNMTTGPLHWELLARARAVDNQVWVGMCSPARSAEAGYTAWGHSMVVDPNGEVVAGMEEGEGYVEWELVPERVVEVRRGIPVTSQRRFDVYADVAVAAPTEGGGEMEGV